MAPSAELCALLGGAELATAAREAQELLSATGRGTASFPFDSNSASSLNELALSPQLLEAAARALGARRYDVRLAEAGLQGPAMQTTEEDSHLAAPSGGEAVVAVVPLLQACRGSEGHQHPPAGSALLMDIGLETPFLSRSPLTLRVTLRTRAAEWIQADAFIRAGPVRLAKLPIQV